MSRNDEFNAGKHRYPLGGWQGPEAALRARASWEGAMAKDNPAGLKRFTEPVNHGAASALINYQHRQTHVYGVPREPGGQATFDTLYDKKR